MAHLRPLGPALALSCLVAPSPAAAQSGKSVAVYVGTFTDRTSRGIYRFEFDPATGAATTPVLAAEMRKPSFLERHYLDPAQLFVLSPDLGADRVFVHRYAADEGRLEPHGAAVLEPGSGPRHLAFDPSGRHVYVINELSQTITVFAYDAAAGALTALDTVSTRPSGFTGTNATAEVALSADGRFAYASNRGHDSIAVFRVEKDGRLLPSGHVPAGGRTPRHFAIDPSGRWLLVAHQDSDSIAVFRLDPRTGLPAPTGVMVVVPEPVCLLFTSR